MPALDTIREMLAVRKEELRVQYRITRIGVFGSVSRGECTPSSDVDILVDFVEPVSLLEWVKAENYLSELLGVKVDLVPRRDVRPELLDAILADVLYV